MTKEHKQTLIDLARAMYRFRKQGRARRASDMQLDWIMAVMNAAICSAIDGQFSEEQFMQSVIDTASQAEAQMPRA